MLEGLVILLADIFPAFTQWVFGEDFFFSDTPLGLKPNGFCPLRFLAGTVSPGELRGLDCSNPWEVPSPPTTGP